MKLWNSNDANRAFKSFARVALMMLWALSATESIAAVQVSEAQPGPLSPDSIFQSQENSETADRAAAASQSNEQDGTVLSGTRAVGSLIFILALILITMVLLKRYMPHRFGPLGHKRRIQVLETVPIGEKRNLTLVEIDGSTLLLASTPNSVSLLKEIHTDRSVAASVQSDQPSTAQPKAEANERKDGSAGAESPDTAIRFTDTLAAEVLRTAAYRRPNTLARISQIRTELEAK